MKKILLTNLVFLANIFIFSCSTPVNVDINYLNITLSENKIAVGSKKPIVISINTNPLLAGTDCSISIIGSNASFTPDSQSLSKKVKINYDGKIEEFFYTYQKSGEVYIKVFIENNNSKIEKLIAVNILPVSDINLDALPKEVKEKEETLLSFKVPAEWGNNDLDLKSSITNSLRLITDAPDKFSDKIKVPIDANGYASAIFKTDNALKNNIVITASLFDTYKSASLKIITIPITKTLTDLTQEKPASVVTPTTVKTTQDNSTTTKTTN